MKRTRLAGAAAAAALLLSGCGVFTTDMTPDRIRQGVADLDLTVTGRPTPGTLAAVEHTLARLKERDAEGLADLVVRDDDGTRQDAERWVEQWGDAAQKPATVDFSEPMKISGAEVRFQGTRKPLDLSLRYDFEDRAERVGPILRD